MSTYSNEVFVAPTDNRLEPGSVNIPPVELPPTEFPSDFEEEHVSNEFVGAFNRYLNEKDYQGLANLFLDDGYWRDHLCLSWDFRTLKGPAAIVPYLDTYGDSLIAVALDKSSPQRMPRVKTLDAAGKSKCVLSFIKVSTKVGSGQGVMRLVCKDGEWKALTFYTALRSLDGFEERRGSRRPIGAQHGSFAAQNWTEKRAADRLFTRSDPQVLIIGAGQAGLTSAARLKMLGVDALIIDKNQRVGDNWRQRYRHLILHDPVWFDHLPYLEFPDHWPIFTPKDKLGDFFESYAEILELNVWMQTSLVPGSTSWDDTKKEWTVVIERHVGDQTERRTLHPHHIIQATGHSGKKNLPLIKGMDSFKGRLCHSSDFPGAESNSEGKRVIVVGSCNSGHDIAQDYYQHGYDVTMVQRSSTTVISSQANTEVMLSDLYREDGPPVEDADLMQWGLPAALTKTQQVENTAIGNERDKQTLLGLQKAGFKLDKGIDNGGLPSKYYQRGGGYYIDVGCSQLIVDGKVKIKQGEEIVEVLPNGLLFTDGSKLKADEIVFATGYQNMRTQTREIFGDKIADQVKDVWGYDEEGEQRAIWRYSGHPGFWFMGGNLAMCRYFSRLLALQIKAVEESLAKYGEHSLLWRPVS